MSSLPPLSGSSGLGNLGTSSGLGNLAQSARQQQIKSARRIMFVIACINFLWSSVFLIGGEFLVNAAIDKEIRDLHAQGMEVDQAAVEPAKEQMRQAFKFVGGLIFALGVVYVAFGLLVNKYPIPITILGLVIYLGSIAIWAYLDASTLLAGGIIGIVIRIAIIVGLVKAVRAAIAQQKNLNQITGKPDAVGLGADL